ncbi:hypothetical protein, partial [Escherichia coli]|uniref:hypothetical protein n=1 Tax=Escherichia coli TaxID=562 RepID=UPI0037BF79CB
HQREATPLTEMIYPYELSGAQHEQQHTEEPDNKRRDSGRTREQGTVATCCQKVAGCDDYS